MIKTRVENIGPEQAKQYLTKNKINRKIRLTTVQTFAAEMAAGRWMLNHQGIAFDTDDNLVDGQHRLHAIIMAAVNVELLVTRGIDAVRNDGIKLYAMDTVDRGNPRTIGDQLSIRHGHKNGNSVAAAAAQIVSICVGQGGHKMTVANTLEILKLYGREIGYCVENRSDVPGIRAASTIGACAFAMKCNPDLISQFYSEIVTGEGLKRGDPSYACRESLIASGPGQRGLDKYSRAMVVLNCIRYYCEGEALKCCKNTTAGRDYWIAQQPSRVKAIRELFSKYSGGAIMLSEIAGK